MSQAVIIAAMEREVEPLVKGWQQSSVNAGPWSFRTFAKEELVVVISGIGRKPAEAAAQAAVEQYRPAQLISAGVAGALIHTLKAGSVVTPNVVVDAADGAEYRCSIEAGGVVGGGILVTADEITGSAMKSKLVEGFHALVVDMEAAAVARVAQQSGAGFRCVKAISDEADFPMPPLKRFVNADGSFQTGRFVLWTAVRPWQWARVSRLGRNTAKAARALCRWLENNLTTNVSSGKVDTLKAAELLNVSAKSNYVAAYKADSSLPSE